MSSELMARAQAGDGDAFGELTGPYRRELQMHCYRMLGSFQDAEDALQDTLLSAWRNLDRFEERASIRTWLYRVATNRCLNALRSMKRRPAVAWNAPEIEPPEATRVGEVVWLEPFPDLLIEDGPLGPEARYEETESISLAFVTALQLLPARQRAVLILRDVLGYRAAEVAEMLDTTAESVTSALKRARATLSRRLPPPGDRPAPPRPGSPSEQAVAERFVRAYEAGDIDALVALLTRRRLRLDAADPLRVPGPRRRGPLLCRGHAPPPLRTRGHPGQRPGRLRRLPPRSRRDPPRRRPFRPHPVR